MTKEYVRMEEEIKSPSVNRSPMNRAMLMAAIAGNAASSSSSSPNRIKYTLKRRGKRDSKTELMSRLSQEKLDLSPPSASNAEAAALSSEENGGSSSCSQAMDTADPMYSFKDKAEVFQFCMEQANFEDFLQHVVETDKSFSPKANKIMAKVLSNQMDMDPKLCYSILDRLSEKHAKDFLDHAMQENSTKEILDRISLTTLMGYLQEKVAGDQAAKVDVLKHLEAWFGDTKYITRQETLTFFANSMPDELTNEEMTELLDELFQDKPIRETFDLFTQQMRKML